MKKITIVDCGMGNRASIRNMLKQVGYESVISRRADDILTADLLVLPGIGAFDAFMKALKEYALMDALNEAVLQRKTPVLGICLGMQVLFEKSEEGEWPGLGWIPGEVRSLKKLFAQDEPIKLPHIGWKTVVGEKATMIPDENQYYFVHSYYCIPQDRQHIRGTVELSAKRFPVAVQKDHIYGVQFHPEKSHRYGLEFFKGFIQHVFG